MESNGADHCVDNSFSVALKVAGVEVEVEVVVSVSVVVVAVVDVVGHSPSPGWQSEGPLHARPLNSGCVVI